MKRFLSFFCIIFICMQAKAQYVTISDTAFASFLTANYPSAMSGNLMDTTNALIINEDSLICRYRKINDIYGLQFFDKLKYFNCYYNNLTSLPNLPKTLKYLDCPSNKLNSLPTLPDLVYLDCSSNPLYSLPSLPNSIQELRCNGNGLTSLPVLPASLSTLYCEMNELTSLPSLPVSLALLDCRYNKLGSLPSLPASLRYLDCYSNLLVGLPALPPSLKTLYAHYNKLASIPSLPISLDFLGVSNNKLTSLPALPASLTVLDCFDNFISVLPTFPLSLESLDCRSNRLVSLPNIPSKLLNINCEDNPYLSCLPAYSQDTFQYFRVFLGTGISCISKPIYVPGSTGISGTLPICSTACSIPYNIFGNIHQDISASCMEDSFYNGNVSPGIKVKKFKNGILDQQTYTNPGGYYSFNADITDSIDIIIDTAGQPFLLSCPATGRRSSKITMSDSVFYYQDFGLKCKGVDLGVNSIYGTFRKGFSRPAYISAGEFPYKYKLQCGKGTSGTVTTTISGAASYEAPLSGAMTPSAVSGSTITYNIDDFGSIDMNSAFNIMVKTDSTAVLGNSICIQTIVSTTVTDVNHSNDSMTLCGVVVNSFDPNEKLAFPASRIGANEWITYTINFQNTGTDTAYNIIVRDTLSSYLDPESFTYLASSHNPSIDIKARAVTFNFQKINLLDSLHNEPESHGWVQYKVKTTADLPMYGNVQNKASIYFDDNDPIVTNTTSNINEPLSISYNKHSSEFKLYPNPSSSAITIETKEAGTFKVFDLLGSVVYQTTITKSNTAVNISLPKLAIGLYIYQFVSETNAQQMGKLLIKAN